MDNEGLVKGMYYRKIGEGPALVLLHGFPDSGEIWGNVATELCAAYTVIIPDMPGSGKSRLARETSLAEMAGGVKNILDHEGIEKAVIAGHSMGGYIAMAFAKRWPGRLAGVSLVHSTTAADDAEKIKTRLKAIELIRNGGKEAFVKQMTAKLFTTAYIEANPGQIRDKVKKSLEMEDDGMINFYRAMIAREDTTEVARTALFPMQWILGAEDTIIDYKKILKECHHSRVNFVTLYIECGHMSMFEKLPMLIGDLKKFSSYCHYNPTAE